MLNTIYELQIRARNFASPLLFSCIMYPRADQCWALEYWALSPLEEVPIYEEEIRRSLIERRSILSTGVYIVNY